MNNTSLRSDFELDVAAAMAVPDAAPQFVNEFRARLLAEAENMPKTRQAVPAPRLWFARPALSVPLILFALLTLTTLIIGPQKVWAAVQRFFGYMPGVGYVQTDGGILVLAEAVTVEREGITVSVEQVVADSERTVVLYKVEGLSLQDANSQGEGVATGSRVLLRLPDGTELSQSAGGGEGWGIGYRSRTVFDDLPEGVEGIMLVIPRLQSMPPGAAPENWEIPLQLKPAEGAVTLLPVYEVEQPPVNTDQTAENVPAETSVSVGEDQLSFMLERVVEMEEGFQFEGTVHWQGEQEAYIEFVDQIDVTDATGERVPAEIVRPDEIFNAADHGQINWALRTVGKNQPGPWTITLRSVLIRNYQQISFQIDLGDAPQIGQTWDLAQTFELGGQEIILNSIKISDDPNQGYGIEFYFDARENLVDVSISDPVLIEAGASFRGWGKRENNMQISGIGYDEIPTGLREFSLDGATFLMQGSWQVIWDPPKSAAEAEIGADTEAATPPAVCIYASSWLDLQAQPPALPAGLGGNLLLLTHTGQNLPKIQLVSPDGAIKDTYGTGAWISLSPDGKTIVNPDEDGIHLIDTATGESMLIPNTLGGEYPVWSPDGSEIAFWDWAQASIYRIKLDGSGLTKVYQGSDMIYLAGWSGVSNQLIYLGFASDGPAINGINLDDGSIEILIQTGIGKPNYRPVLSPDGEWLLYKGAIEGDTVNGIFIARLDGSEKHLLVAEDSESRYVLVGGAWSPDGSWVVVNLLGAADGYTNPTPYLINPATCEIVPLPDLSGEAAGWGQ